VFGSGQNLDSKAHPADFDSRTHVSEGAGEGTN
jgi:hypothetical protein